MRLVTKAGFISAKVVKVDAANDLALLKAEGRFAALPVASSRTVRMGSTVATVGFPNIGLQGFAPKLAKGEIAALTGTQDDSKYFQISVPVQPGNSGGALVDERGAKAALRSLTRSLAAELLPRGIRVNAVSPGPIESTAILQKVGMPKEAADQVYAQMTQGVPMKRLGRPEEIAKAVAFLAMDATYTTGVELPVDGGWSQL